MEERVKPRKAYTSKYHLAKLQYVTNVCKNFQKNRSKSVVEVCDTKLLEFCLFVCWGFIYQLYFSYLTATVHKSMFPGLSFNQYLTSPLS